MHLGGSIHDELGEVLIGAQVTLERPGFSKQTQTDLNGAYAFNNLPSGTYVIKVNHDQYISTTTMIQVVQYQQSELSLTLNHRSHRNAQRGLCIN